MTKSRFTKFVVKGLRLRFHDVSFGRLGVAQSRGALTFQRALNSQENALPLHQNGRPAGTPAGRNVPRLAGRPGAHLM